jgi:hypothetical protein
VFVYFPTERPTERKQYDHNEGKAREINDMAGTTKAHCNGA